MKHLLVSKWIFWYDLNGWYLLVVLHDIPVLSCPAATVGNRTTNGVCSGPIVPQLHWNHNGWLQEYPVLSYKTYLVLGVVIFFTIYI